MILFRSHIKFSQLLRLGVKKYSETHFTILSPNRYQTQVSADFANYFIATYLFY